MADALIAEGHSWSRAFAILAQCIDKMQGARQQAEERMHEVHPDVLRNLEKRSNHED